MKRKPRGEMKRSHTLNLQAGPGTIFGPVHTGVQSCTGWGVGRENWRKVVKKVQTSGYRIIKS